MAIVAFVVVSERRGDGLPVALLLVLGLLAVYAALRTTDRGWAWAAARRWAETARDRPWTTIPGPRPPRRLRVSSTPG